MWPELAAALEVANPTAHSPEEEAWASERAKARMRWADERSGEDRRSDPAQSAQLVQAQGRRGGPDRRNIEGPSASRSRRTTQVTALFGAQVPVWVLIGIALLVAGGLALLAYFFGPVNPVPVKLR
jgi:hypothetical protein